MAAAKCKNHLACNKTNFFVLINSLCYKLPTARTPLIVKGLEKVSR